MRDGSTLVLLKKRFPVINRDVKTEPRPTLQDIEEAVAAEAARRGRVVERAPPQQAAPSLGRSVEQQLQQLMQVCDRYQYFFRRLKNRYQRLCDRYHYFF